jgi:hypothetical protein
VKCNNFMFSANHFQNVPGSPKKKNAIDIKPV